MTYQKLFMATVTIDLFDGPQTIIGVSHDGTMAAAHMCETLESLGFTAQQIGRIRDRARVQQMHSRDMAAQLVVPGKIHLPFGRSI